MSTTPTYKAEMEPRTSDFTDIVLCLNAPPWDLVIGDTKVTIGIDQNVWKIRIANAFLQEGKVIVPELYLKEAATRGPIVGK
jgi:hypothetical protein